MKTMNKYRVVLAIVIFILSCSLALRLMDIISMWTHLVITIATPIGQLIANKAISTYDRTNKLLRI